MATVTGLFDQRGDAERAVEQLEDAGISSDNISIVSRTGEGRKVEEQGNKAAEGAGAGAGVGAVAGGAGGLLAGLGMLAIPGVGPVVAAGWLVAALAGAAGGAVVGGAAGGIVGALIKSGVPEEDANVYAESVRRGSSLVVARVDDDEIATANQILDRLPRVNIRERRALYAGQGWQRFDDTLDPYDDADVDSRPYTPPPRF
ncbi:MULTISPECIES: hypothetical protein [Rhizobium]|uniref:General stress protein 17M-like domain-containing protein n=1 Tax=Rhizobium leucaenae TaxID=29450 RepID=A0A7W7EMQ6_9HYPH|nr:hypothetical protein [Rhizobium leucaenae]MBB4570752.1 hypothetical protein [Rhizobium leucaenae]MBB6303707.1 hypothetical protein [Rhizobium leucaenae]